MEPVFTLYENASHTVSTALQAKFSSQFPKVTGPEVDRRYLEDGYIPPAAVRPDGTVDPCFCCGHCFWDEPNENKAKVTRNLDKRARHESKVANDAALVAAGGVPLTEKGKPMQEGRKRNDPTYELLLRHCHCWQFLCMSMCGPVPSSECPTNCIDKSTGLRYGFDPVSGECLCPICQCDSCPRFYTVS